MAKFLIIGLGNIGAEYMHTRHNIGFDVADALAEKLGAAFTSNRLASTAEAGYRGHKLLIIKPSTYMNLSGRAFKYWQEKEKIPLDHTLTIVDDLALPLSKLRIRPGGSPAGHNGLKDIELATGTDLYPKLRFGIGNNYPKGGQVDFVLGRWTESEIPLVTHKTMVSVQAVLDFCFRGLEAAMNTYNKIDIALPG